MAVSTLSAAEPEDMGPKASHRGRGQLRQGCGRGGSVPTPAPCATKSWLLRAHACSSPCRADPSPHNTREVQRTREEEVILYLNNKTPTTFYLRLNDDPAPLSQ